MWGPNVFSSFPFLERSRERGNQSKMASSSIDRISSPPVRQAAVPIIYSSITYYYIQTLIFELMSSDISLSFPTISLDTLCIVP